MSQTSTPTSGLSRRTLLLGAAAGVAIVPATAMAASAAPNYSVIPKLPLEVSRMDTQTSRFGQKYESIDVSIEGDLTRLFVPHGVKVKNSSVKNAVVWYYHATGSDYTAMSNAFKYGAEMVLKEGVICICPNFGGDLWVTDAAIDYQKRASRYLSNVFTIGLAFGRANSGGAALMCYALAKNLVPAMRGIYSANGAINVEDLYSKDQTRIGAPYGNDLAKIKATNPTNLPAADWKGKRMRFVMSAVDPICPPTLHGGKILVNAGTGPIEGSYRLHDQGHVVPSFVHQDMIDTFKRWSNL